MKQVLVSAVVAAIVAALFLQFGDMVDLGNGAPAVTTDAVSDGPDSGTLNFTDALVEDTWVNGSRTAGSDRRSLSNASNSICYLTKIEVSGIQSPEDSNSCEIVVDDFTGFWELVATVNEGGQSEVRCNARCLSWE